MRLLKFSFLLLFLFLTTIVNSQNLTYARQVLDTLTSPYFSGRGAVDKGEQKAALFIAREFKKLGLKMVHDNYLQPFKYPLNTFPGKISVSFSDKSFIPGEDFLVDPKSVKKNGTFEVISYNHKNVPKKKQLQKLKKQGFFSNKFIVVDDYYTDKTEIFDIIKSNEIEAAGLILIEEEKLTHHLSQKVADYVVLHVMRDKLSEKIDSISIEIEQQFLTEYTSQNVLGKIEGSEFPDSIIVISAHYDHLGMMGKDVYFPGANDNASGIAMLLNLAEYYTHKEPPKKTIIFIAFGAEESGLVGSKYFTDHPLFSLSKINFMINVDIMGTGDEGIQVVNGSVFRDKFDMLVSINENEQLLEEVKIRGKAANSDHYWFTEKGVPAFFIYTLGGIKAYHDIYDISATLPLTEFEDCFRLIKNFVDEL